MSSKETKLNCTHFSQSGVTLFFGGLFLTYFSENMLGQFLSFATSSTYHGFLMLFELLISTSVAYSLNFIALKWINPSTAGMFTFFQPVFTALLLWIFFQDTPRMSLLALIAGFLVGVAVFRLKKVL